MERYVTQTKFAEMARLAVSSVGRAAKKWPPEAKYGKRIDLEHPVVAAYLEKHTGDPTPVRPPAKKPGRVPRSADGTQAAPAVPKPKSRPPATPRPPLQSVVSSQIGAMSRKNAPPSNAAPGTAPDNIHDLADWPLKKIIGMFGSDVRFVDWLRATKEIEIIAEKRLKNAETERRLVSRRLVKVGIIEPIDTAHSRLLQDGVRTIARRVVAMHEAGDELPDIEAFIADQIGSFIRPAKTQIKRTMQHVTADR